MAAEEGGKAVAAAVAEEHDARGAIETLAESIQRASEAATQIAVSSHQQMVGVDQVGTAMQNIRAAANQNAGGMRQLEQSTQRLKELGQKLVELMRRYRT
jgi:methyl-accepting chemotaxis protein